MPQDQIGETKHWICWSGPRPRGGRGGNATVRPPLRSENSWPSPSPSLPVGNAKRWPARRCKWPQSGSLHSFGVNQRRPTPADQGLGAGSWPGPQGFS